MQPLPTSFKGYGEVKGIYFTQLFRHQDLALYVRSDGVYEIIQVRKQKAIKGSINGKDFQYEAKERYPIGNEFGKYTYDFATIHVDRVFELLNRQSKGIGYDFVMDRETFDGLVSDFELYRKQLFITGRMKHPIFNP